MNKENPTTVKMIASIINNSLKSRIINTPAYKQERSILEMVVFTIGMLGIAAVVCLILCKVGNVQEIPSDSPNTFAECQYRALRGLRGEK
jgi:hypothetical protein